MRGTAFVNVFRKPAPRSCVYIRLQTDKRIPFCAFFSVRHCFFRTKSLLLSHSTFFLNPCEGETERRTIPMEEGWDEDKAEIDAMGCIGGIAGGKRYLQARKKRTQLHTKNPSQH